MSKRRKFSAEFKAKVALEALSGGLALSELEASGQGRHGGVLFRENGGREKRCRCRDQGIARQDRPTHGGFLYLVAIMDWHSRTVLSWRLSNTMDTDFWWPPWKKP